MLHGFGVQKQFVAESGDDFKRLVETGNIDLVICELVLKDAAGANLIGWLRRLEDKPMRYIPIIAVSANAIPRDIAACLEAGFDAYLTKPIRVGDFMDRLDRALQAATAPSGATSTAASRVPAGPAGTAAVEATLAKPL